MQWQFSVSSAMLHCCNHREEREELSSAVQSKHKEEGLVPFIPVVIWTCGLGGLLPAPFFAEIYKQTNKNRKENSRKRDKHRKDIKTRSVLKLLHNFLSKSNLELHMCVCFSEYIFMCVIYVYSLPVYCSCVLPSDPL